MKALEWGGKEGFNAAEDEPWTLTTGLIAIDGKCNHIDVSIL